MSRANGHMVWPQYGVTPDLGLEATVGGLRAMRARLALVSSHWVSMRRRSAGMGSRSTATEPVQVNPTASVSGLLDKMAATGRQGRALGRALS